MRFTGIQSDWISPPLFPHFRAGDYHASWRRPPTRALPLHLRPLHRLPRHLPHQRLPADLHRRTRPCRQREPPRRRGVRRAIKTLLGHQGGTDLARDRVGCGSRDVISQARGSQSPAGSTKKHQPAIEARLQYQGTRSRSLLSGGVSVHGIGRRS